jgi:hypothetical protein
VGNQDWGGPEWPGWWPLEEPREPEEPAGDGEESEERPAGPGRMEKPRTSVGRSGLLGVIVRAATRSGLALARTAGEKFCLDFCRS